MKFNEINKVGLYAVVINIIIIMFLYTSGNDLAYYITCIASSMIAFFFNFYFIKKSRTIYNLVGLVLNLIILDLVILNSIYIFI
ncbi:MAG TPA: hypothetical protein PKG93_00630 [Bacilli bacterium]|jgi:hypothetical protein|nr:hypothetical protein [Bacilli bacterium]